MKFGVTAPSVPFGCRRQRKPLTLIRAPLSRGQTGALRGWRAVRKTKSELPRSKLRGINSAESLQRSKLRGIRPVVSEACDQVSAADFISVAGHSLWLHQTPLRDIRAEQVQAGLASPWVFPNPLTGKPYRHDMKTSWYTALRKAGIADFHFHDLRHTCASYLRMQGVDLLTIAEILGHKDLKMTRRYAHVAPTHRLAAIGLLDHAYSTQHAVVAKSVADAENAVIEQALSS